MKAPSGKKLGAAVVKRDESTGMAVWSPDHIGTSVPWFEAHLAKQGIGLQPNSDLGQAIENVRSYREVCSIGRLRTFPSTEAAYDFYASVYGAELLTKSTHWGSSCGFQVPTDRLAQLVRCDPLVTRPGRNSKHRNMTWEVVIACLSSTFASSVVFAEPDVQCEFLGQRFAVAAKVAYSEKKLRARVMEGFDQADGQADASLVFVDVVQLFSPAKILERSRKLSFRHNDEAVAMFNPEIDHWLAGLGVNAWRHRLKEKASRPVGVAFFLPLLLHSASLGGPAAYFSTRIPAVWSESSVDGEFARRFEKACVEVMGFRARAGGIE